MQKGVKRARSLIGALSLIAYAATSCSNEDPAFIQINDPSQSDSSFSEITPGGENTSSRSSGDSVFSEGSQTENDSVPNPEIIFTDGDQKVTQAPNPDLANSSGDTNVDTKVDIGVDTKADQQDPDSMDMAALNNPGALGNPGALSNPGATDVTNIPADLDAANALGVMSNTEQGTKSNSQSQSHSNSGEIPASSALTVLKSFDVKSTRQVSGSFYVEDRWISQPIVITERTESIDKTFQQTTRPTLTSTFEQGKSGQAYVETLPQIEASGVLDLLVVIDNSGSMSNEQKNLSSKLSPLLSYVSQSDWKIGVVTTDPNDSCMRALIKKGDANALESFEEAIKAGLAGSGQERGILQAVTGLSCPNSPWLRESSTAAVLIVSDEDNCSNGAGCGNNPWNNENYLLNFLENDLQRDLGADARVYGLFKHPTDNSCSTALNVAHQYASAVSKSGGTWGSICAADYSNTLSRISQDVASILKKQFALKTMPDPSTVSVTLILGDGTRQEAKNYSLTGSVITFTQPPPSNSSIEVAYSTFPETQLKQFDLGSPAAEGTVKVQIGKQVIASSAYTVSGTKLTFTTPPAPESQIKVSYKKDVTLEKSFELGTGIKSNSITVSINNNPLASNAFSYDAANGKLNFKLAPLDGSTIKVMATKTNGPELNYSVMTSGQSITEVKAQYADNVEVKVTANAEQLTLSNPAQAHIGKTLWVQFRVSGARSKTYQLPSAPTPGSLLLTSSSENCKVGKEIVAIENAINVVCALSGQLKVDYRYETYSEPTRIFEFSAARSPDLGRWEVSVDGHKIEENDYNRSANIITLKPEVMLNHHSKVSITFSEKIL